MGPSQISPGERVRVRDGGVGALISRNDESHVVVKMDDTKAHMMWECEGRAGARMKRECPSLRYKRDDSRGHTHRSVEARHTQLHLEMAGGKQCHQPQHEGHNAEADRVEGVRNAH